jgi:cytochrome b6-f complex iron-sulfur subunit
MTVLLLAIGLAEAFYAPQPMAPAQYATMAYAPTPALEAQPVYVPAPTLPSAETRASGSSLLSGAAFVAGLSVALAALANHAPKKATIVDGVNAMTKPWAPLTQYEQKAFAEETDAQRKIAMLATLAEGDFVPDMQRRTIMNLVLLGGAAVPVGWLGGGFVYFFVPPSGGGGGGGLVAKDALGDDVVKAKWVAAHPSGQRSLVQGLKGDAHYLIVEPDGSIRDYALNAVCTHLGCVVPWNRAANKFMCPCHGSQYDETGKVVRGPAPLSLALAHLNIDETDKVVLSPWTETDFRTDLKPWWKP